MIANPQSSSSQREHKCTANDILVEAGWTSVSTSTESSEAEDTLIAVDAPPSRGQRVKSVLKVSTLDDSLKKYNKSAATTKHDSSSDDDNRNSSGSSTGNHGNLRRGRSRSRSFGDLLHAASSHHPHLHLHLRRRAKSIDAVNQISPADWSLRCKTRAKPRCVGFDTVQFRLYDMDACPNNTLDANADAECNDNDDPSILPVLDEEPIQLEEYEVNRPPRRRLQNDGKESYAWGLYRELSRLQSQENGGDLLHRVGMQSLMVQASEN